MLENFELNSELEGENKTEIPNNIGVNSTDSTLFMAQESLGRFYDTEAGAYIEEELDAGSKINSVNMEQREIIEDQNIYEVKVEGEKNFTNNYENFDQTYYFDELGKPVDIEAFIEENSEQILHILNAEKEEPDTTLPSGQEDEYVSSSEKNNETEEVLITNEGDNEATSTENAEEFVVAAEENEEEEHEDELRELQNSTNKSESEELIFAPEEDDELEKNEQTLTFEANEAEEITLEEVEEKTAGDIASLLGFIAERAEENGKNISV